MDLRSAVIEFLKARDGDFCQMCKEGFIEKHGILPRDYNPTVPDPV